MIPVFRATVTKCRLDIHDQQKWVIYLAGLNGKEVEVTVKKPEKKRSQSENRYFHGIVLPILCDYFGYDAEEMKDALKMKFLLIESGKIPTVRKTSSLSTVEFEDFMTKVRQWAAQEWQVYIPLPNEIEF